jgi:pimeloyl-ACP methyl ester carboxylesterase
MVVFPYLCRYHQELERAVIMNVVVPGLKPWDEVLRNPYIWHFGFHSVPDLPEKLVSGKQREYFDYFFNTITADPKHITDEARYRYAQAYASPSALTTGFNWYRAFQQDAKDNREGIAGQQRIETPLLYLRGDHEYGKIDDYVAGFKEANIANIQSAIIPNSGHFAPEEQPEAIWEKIAAFMEL